MMVVKPPERRGTIRAVTVLSPGTCHGHRRERWCMPPATEDNIRLHVPSTVHVLRSLVLSSNNSQSATNTFGAWLSSELDGLAYIISPLLPESLLHQV